MHAWKQLRGEMVATGGRNFAQFVATLLRFFWEDLAVTPEDGELAANGVDLAAGITDGRIAFAVQCHAAAASAALGLDDCAEICRRIDAFTASSFTCGEYVVFHNRDGRDAALTGMIEGALARVVAAGKAKRTKVWDTQIFSRYFDDAMRDDLKRRLAQQSERFLGSIANLFEFGSVYVPRVPLSQHRLMLRRGEAPEFGVVAPAALHEPARMITSSSEVRWTLLMGLYGSGKSSSALRAAQYTNRMVIYVRCADMRPREGGVSTNSLMETILRQLDLFTEFDDASRERFTRLSRSNLRSELIATDNRALLILDGLDENRQYATPRGVVTLSNVLSELKCPILLTTRKEHFEATFSNYDQLLIDHSDKGGARREARIFRLERWQDEQVAEFLDEALRQSATARTTLVRLRDRLKRGECPERELELLRHPLLLQMIVDLAGSGEEAGTTSADVLGKWTALKMRRDLETDRVLPTEVHNAADYIDTMGQALEDVAGAMVEQRGGLVTLAESVPAATAIEAVAKAFPGTRQDVLTVTSASLLVPTGPQTEAGATLAFSLRIFQEYYLARHLVRAGHRFDGYPPDVRRLCEELSARDT